jgi:hypothetical protein
MLADDTEGGTSAAAKKRRRGHQPVGAAKTREIARRRRQETAANPSIQRSAACCGIGEGAAVGISLAGELGGLRAATGDLTGERPRFGGWWSVDPHELRGAHSLEPSTQVP